MNLPPLPRPFVPSGGCTCAGPHGPCEACQANEEAWREWMDEPNLSPREAKAYAEQYGRLCTEASTAELDRLHARVAELEVDAERSAWLFENYSSLLCTHQGMAPKVTFQPCLLNKDFAPAMLRAAIDTARKAKP